MSMPTSQTAVSPIVLGDFIQPGFPFAKVFSVYFVDNQMVFARVGSGGTNAAGAMRASLGGSTPVAMIAGAIGALVDGETENSRSEKSSQLGSQKVDQMICADKHNFAVPFEAVSRVEIKGPNWFREVKVLIVADRQHKFRVDKQSQDSARTIFSIFQQFLPGKIFAA